MCPDYSNGRPESSRALRPRSHAVPSTISRPRSTSWASSLPATAATARGFAGKAAYNSAKHGLLGLTKVAALEGAPHGITVNALCPGYVDTPLVRNQLADLARTRGVPLERVLEDVIYPLVPMRRLLTVREIADYAVFLVSDKGAGITGTAAVIDGGYTAQ